MSFISDNLALWLIMFVCFAGGVFYRQIRWVRSGSGDLAHGMPLTIAIAFGAWGSGVLFGISLIIRLIDYIKK